MMIIMVAVAVLVVGGGTGFVMVQPLGRLEPTWGLAADQVGSITSSEHQVHSLR